MNIAIVHGMFVRNGGKHSVQRLVIHLERAGHEVKVIRYGFWGIIRVYLGNKHKTTVHLVQELWNADVIITHSRGATVTERALRKMPRWTPKYLLFHLSPSLNRNTDPPRNVLHRWVYHSAGDFIVKVSRFLPFLEMGDMGAFGYNGISRHNTNVDVTKVIGEEHSDGWFRGQNAATTARRIDYEIRNYT